MPSEFMSSELTIIISVLVPIMGLQIVIMLFLFRRMDGIDARQTEERREVEKRQTEERREMEQRLIQRMDGIDARQTEERHATEQRLINRMDGIDTRQTEERREMEQRLLNRMDKSDEEVNGLRGEVHSISNRLARIEGAVEVLRDLIERFVSVRG